MSASKFLHLSIRLAMIFFLYGSSVVVYPQNLDYDKIMGHANKTPFEIKNSAQKLSSYLTSPYRTEAEKFASIYYWVAKNIKYDDEMAKNPPSYIEMKEVLDKVMKSKSGVCMHFAELFVELAQLAGLKVYFIEGYTLDNGKVAKMSHAWNLIKISNSWYFIDATWANAVIKSKGKNTFPDEYFMVKPEKSIMTHMPFDPIWQILSNPIKYDQFDNNKFDIADGNFNYNDSISNYLASDSISQQMSIMRRMKANGTFNILVKKEFTLKEKNLKIDNRNQEVYKFNAAIVSLKNGVNCLNQYIKLKNNQFKDKKYGKEAIIGILDSASVNLQKAESTFTSIKFEDVKMKPQVKENMMSINKSKGLIIKEREFVSKFFK